MDGEEGRREFGIWCPRIDNIAPGTRLFENFTLQKVLGRTVSGVVWLAHDDRLDRQVALKLCPRPLQSDWLVDEDLRRETRQCLPLAHPNIARIFACFEDPEMTAVAREYVDGPTLSELRLEKRANCFAVSEIAPWVSSLCDALAYAHDSMGVMHRALKPSNLMVSESKELKITDFGIAAALRGGGSDESGLDYLSPQRLRGEPPTPADDIYAAGAVLYELLSSQPPFFDLPAHARTGAVPWVAERRKELGIVGEDVPRHWEETLAACLARDPSARPPTSLELARRLRLGGAIRLTVAQQEVKTRGLIHALFEARIVGAAAGVAALVAAAVILLHAMRTPAMDPTAHLPSHPGFAMEVPLPEAAPTSPAMDSPNETSIWPADPSPSPVRLRSAETARNRRHRKPPESVLDKITRTLKKVFQSERPPQGRGKS